MHTSKIQAAPVTAYFLLVFTFTVPNYTFKFLNSVVNIRITFWKYRNHLQKKIFFSLRRAVKKRKKWVSHIWPRPRKLGLIKDSSTKLVLSMNWSQLEVLEAVDPPLRVALPHLPGEKLFRKK